MTDLSSVLDAIGAQTEMANELSIAGTGAVLFSWLRVHAVIADDALRGFARPGLLTVPLCSFVLAIACGYVIAAATTGFQLELATGHAQTGEPITDAAKHFRVEYMELFETLGAAQLAASMFGAVSLAVWYSGNVWLRRSS